ncbi:putative intracellular protease/amidase [Bacillus pakistanensis]|uniref:Intracellular protease/amidase n=1 Tax=Rossellomorea pakistanensis TaxID=992288 RepID=A0ABS2N8H1_9BACI|nr:type 1 glutamine amidotransferase domain-containing protein [Bacillus pakistanensis]MBM7583871.1 putative intracellular protease/amidase [Bacillus pakistanensis]
MKKVLMVLTNTDHITDEQDTGLWLSEFAEPYVEFKKNGFIVDVASINGGSIPIDPSSVGEEEQPDTWKEAINELNTTLVLSQLNIQEYSGIFLPGGHGTMFDFPDNATLNNTLVHFAENNKIIGAVCHGPAGFVDVKLSTGKWIVDGKRVTGFTNEEEQQTNLDSLMPFLLESKLREQGAYFEKLAAFSDHVVVDENFVTGQNPRSSQSTAEAFVKELNR